MSQIVIGTADHKNAGIDLDVLLATRLLVQANSGGGKSWLLRRLAEQLYGKVPVIIIDPEGEFATLREKFDYFLVGEGGDVPAHERSAPLLAETLLKLRANAVCDLYETFRKNPMGRHLWVKAFLGGLLDAPKSLWRPTVIIVDEAHTFCPEKGESPAEGVMVGLATAGRKRHFCPIWATQRLALLQKDGSSQLQNRMVGLTFEDVDVDRAAALLSIAREDIHDFKKQVKTLEPGYFFAFGRAISKERILVHVGPVLTSHEAETGSGAPLEPPPPPEKIKALLPKLAELPRTAEEKARTIAELKVEIRSLKGQLRSGAVAKKVIPDARIIGRAVARVDSDLRAKFARQVGDMQRVLHRQLLALREIAQVSVKAANMAPPKLEPIEHTKIPGGEIQTKGAQSYVASRPVERVATPQIAHPRLESNNGSGELSRRQMEILRALAELEAVGQTAPSKECVAAWSRYKATGGGFGNNLGNLKTKGLVHYPGQRTVALTEHGRDLAGPQGPPSQEELAERAAAILSGPQKKILDVLREVYPEALCREELAERTGYHATGGGFGNLVGNMHTAGVVDYPQPGQVRCAEWLFLE